MSRCLELRVPSSASSDPGRSPSHHSDRPGTLIFFEPEAGERLRSRPNPLEPDQTFRICGLRKAGPPRRPRSSQSGSPPGLQQRDHAGRRPRDRSPSPCLTNRHGADLRHHGGRGRGPRSQDNSPRHRGIGGWYQGTATADLTPICPELVSRITGHKSVRHQARQATEECVLVILDQRVE